MFDLAAGADDRAFAIALNRLGIAAERADQRLRHLEPKRLQIIREADDVDDIATGEGILDDGQDRASAVRRSGLRAALVEDVLDCDDAFANLNGGHGGSLSCVPSPREAGRGWRA